jgi:hypothetical protein
MTKAGNFVGATGTGSTSVAIYYLVNPTIGTNNFVCKATRGGGNFIR